MRIESGVTTRYIYFVAVDSTDYATRETGLSSFTVYRSRNGAAAAAMTTPTINETDATNMPGVYELLLDEDMTIASGNDSEEMVYHITATGMAPVTRTIELYRPKITAGNTLGVAADGDVSGNVDGSVASVTAAITLPTIPANWITAAGINASALDGKGDWNIGKTGYSISGTKTTLDALNDIAATSIVSAGAITTLAGAVVNVDLVDTCTTNTDMRGTDSAATATALATVDTNVDAILVDTGTTLETHLTDIKGGTFSGATDSLEAIRDRGDSAWTTGAGGTPPQLLQNTTIATLASQTSFTLTAGSADDDAYNGAVVVVTDQSTSTQKAVGSVSDYTGATKTITLSSDPAIFTMAAGDTIDIIANASTAPTAAAVADAVLDEALSGHTTAGTLGKAVADIETDATAILADTNELQTDDVPGLIAALNDVAATDIVSSGAITTLAGAVVNVDLVDTCTTNTDMRGTDSANTTTPPTAASVADAVLDEALSGHTTAGTLGKAIADIETDAAAILVDTGTTLPSTLSAIAGYIDTEVSAIKAVTDNLPDSGALTTISTAISTIDGIVDNILIDTNELQTDLADGGRLDLILDAILSDTGTDGVVLSTAERNALADAILDRDMATGTDSGSTSVRTVRQALRMNRNKVSVSGGTLTVTKEDDSTTSWTAAVTTTAGDPITTVDPA